MLRGGSIAALLFFCAILSWLRLTLEEISAVEFPAMRKTYNPTTMTDLRHACKRARACVRFPDAQIGQPLFFLGFVMLWACLLLRLKLSSEQGEIKS